MCEEISDCSQKICALPQCVVDKIAAGEVVVRPVNAVKELIENSLDAGATEIGVTIRNGGLDLIKIQDNGCGIGAGDMPIVCARFTTSKLKEYEDLRRISTYGFRGEALASVSYVSHVSITSRTEAEKCAHRAKFQDGKMLGGLCQTAGLVGTTICAEQLFYNSLSRRSAMKYPNEEANRIADLVIKYSIYYSNVSFSFCRLDGMKTRDFRTKGEADQHSVIRSLLHSNVTKDLINFAFSDDRLHFTVKLCMAMPLSQFSSRAIQTKQDIKKVFHLFINGRCVECPRMKQALDAVFTAMDSMCPFMTLSLEIAPERIDVNVHPTKSIVHFLEENTIIERIEQEVHSLASQYREKGVIELPSAPRVRFRNPLEESTTNFEANRKRKFAADSSSNSLSGNLLTKSASLVQEVRRIAYVGQSPNLMPVTSASSPGISINPNQRLRVDFRNRSLDEFIQRDNDSGDDQGSPVSAVSSAVLLKTPLQRELSSELANAEHNENNEHRDNVFIGEDDDFVEGNEPESENSDNGISACSSSTPSSEFDLDSLVDLRKSICSEVDPELRELIKKHVFVGFYNAHHSIIQSGTTAYIFQNEKFLSEFFYQLIIFSFGNIGVYRLIPEEDQLESEGTQNDDGLSVDVKSLLKLYLSTESTEACECDGIQLDELCANLSARVGLLWEYFSVEIVVSEDSGKMSLQSLPCLIDGYVPQMAAIPRLLYALATVEEENDRECYKSIAWALAEFHAPKLLDEADEGSNDDEEIAECSQIQNLLQKMVFPYLRNKFLPPQYLQKYIQELINTEDAFKKFGRC